MIGNINFVVAFWSSCVVLIVAQQPEQPLRIRITDTYAETCKRYAGKVNQEYIRIDRRKIVVRDGRTFQEVPYISLPGLYQLEFRDVQIERKNLEYLVGDLTVTIRAPVNGTEVEMLAIPIGPKQNPRNPCDRDSHLVGIRVDESACRYCDLCKQTRKLERELIRRREIVGLRNEQRFSDACHTFEQGKYYTLTRTIALPEPNTADRRIKSEVELGEALQKAFAIGQGKIIAMLRLLTKPRSITESSYCQQKCVDNLSCARCKFEYSQKKQNGQVTGLSQQHNCEIDDDLTELAACYRIEFLYRADKDQQQAALVGLPAGAAAQQGVRGSSGDPCAKEISLKRTWCRSCWWCAETFCSKQCRCFQRKEAECA